MARSKYLYKAQTGCALMLYIIVQFEVEIYLIIWNTEADWRAIFIIARIHAPSLHTTYIRARMYK